MAKGDKKKVQSAVDTSVQNSQQGIDALRNNAIIPEYQRNSALYDTSANMQMADYRRLMDDYSALAREGAGKNNVGFDKVTYNRTPEMEEAFGGYRNFMNTGGLSDVDQANLRARGISPIRAVYANSINEMERQKNLAGGYSPNFNAAAARMRSGTSQQIADQVQNVNAAIAEMVQKGKMFGTEGMGNLSVQDTRFGQDAQHANLNAALEIARNNLIDPRFQALNAQASLYGATPGLARTFGDMTDRSIGNWLQAEGLNQNVGQQRIGGQMQVASVPSNFETGFGRVGQGLQMAGGVAGAFMGLPGGVRSPIPTKPMAGTGNINSGLYGAPQLRY